MQDENLALRCCMVSQSSNGEVARQHLGLTRSGTDEWLYPIKRPSSTPVSKDLLKTVFGMVHPSTFERLKRLFVSVSSLNVSTLGVFFSD